MIKLEEGDCFKEAKESLVKTHAEIMQLRHAFIAHRDDSEHEQAIVYLKLPKSDPIPNKSEYRIRAVKLSCPNVTTLTEYLEVFMYLQNYVENKIQLTAEKVHKRFMYEFSPEELKHFLI